jgi:hypothetical protein
VNYATIPLYSGGERSEGKIMRNNNLTMLGALALALTVGVAAPSPAWADVTTVFGVSGDFYDGTMLTGNVTIDVTAGDATAIDVTDGSFHFGSILEQFSESGLYIIGSATSRNSAHLFLTFPVESLIGYDGGALSTETRVDDLLNDSSTSLASGSATAVKTPAVPELSTWAIMLLGFAGLGYVAFRTSNKNVAATV